jgi:hypothetical protein
MAKINRVVARHQEGMDDKTVFDEILDSNLSEFEKRPERLMEESQNIAIAGTETTAWTLSVCYAQRGSKKKLTGYLGYHIPSSEKS